MGDEVLYEPEILVEDQGEDESELEETPDFSGVSVNSRDWTVETLVNQMRKGNLDLDPAFQRRGAWDYVRKSVLIESLILGFPVPQIVLAESPDQKGKFVVVDGKQRLLSLRQFFKDNDNENDNDFEPLQLKQLKLRKDLNNLFLDDLRDQFTEECDALENTTIRTIVLAGEVSHDLLFALFTRLNTQSLQLSPQELRQAITEPGFARWLAEASGSSAAMLNLLNNSEPDRRMVDVEIALRGMAFSASEIPYKGSMKKFLDDSSRQFGEQWKIDDSKCKKEFSDLEKAIQFGLSELGRNSFARSLSTTSNSEYQSRLNRSVLDVQVWSFSHSEVREKCSGRGKEISQKFLEKLASDEELLAATRSTTKTRKSFLVRHNAWRSVLEEVCGAKYDLPSTLS